MQVQLLVSSQPPGLDDLEGPSCRLLTSSWQQACSAWTGNCQVGARVDCQVGAKVDCQVVDTGDCQVGARGDSQVGPRVYCPVRARVYCQAGDRVLSGIGATRRVYCYIGRG